MLDCEPHKSYVLYNLTSSPYPPGFLVSPDDDYGIHSEMMALTFNRNYSGIFQDIITQQFSGPVLV